MYVGAAMQAQSSSHELWISRHDIALECVVIGSSSILESSGKATVALHAVAGTKKNIAAFIDAEHALDPSYAAALGSQYR